MKEDALKKLLWSRAALKYAWVACAGALLFACGNDGTTASAVNTNSGSMEGSVDSSIQEEYPVQENQEVYTNPEYIEQNPISQEVFSSSSVEIYTQSSSSAVIIPQSSSAVIISQSSSAVATSPCSTGELYVKATNGGEDKCYKTKAVGGKTWMAEDLVVYANLESYTRMPWYFAMNITEGNESTTFYSESETPQGRCPTGWHVASLSEWNALLSNGSFDVSAMNMDGGCGVIGAPVWWTSTKTGSNPYYCDPCESAESACSAYTSDSYYEYHVRCVKN